MKWAGAILVVLLIAASWLYANRPRGHARSRDLSEFYAADHPDLPEPILKGLRSGELVPGMTLWHARIVTGFEPCGRFGPNFLVFPWSNYIVHMDHGNGPLWSTGWYVVCAVEQGVLLSVERRRKVDLPIVVEPHREWNPPKRMLPERYRKWWFPDEAIQSSNETTR